MHLFDPSEKERIPFQLPDADVIYYPNFFPPNFSEMAFQKLYAATSWQQDDITIFGKTHPQPRLTALYGENTNSYSYSGVTMYPKPFTSLLTEIKEYVEAVTMKTFTTVLLNLYRDGNDSNGWHSDDEKELGDEPEIASVSFGANRNFRFKHKRDRSLTHSLELENGSLLVMRGATQHNWKHQLPKTKKVIGPRINLTFRSIL